MSNKCRCMEINSGNLSDSRWELCPDCLDEHDRDYGEGIYAQEAQEATNSLKRRRLIS